MQQILVDDLIEAWMEVPEFRAEHDALEDEFALTSALIEARTKASMTQEQMAAKVATT